MEGQAKAKSSSKAKAQRAAQVKHPCPMILQCRCTPAIGHAGMHLGLPICSAVNLQGQLPLSVSQNMCQLIHCDGRPGRSVRGMRGRAELAPGALCRVLIVRLHMLQALGDKGAKPPECKQQ